MWRIGLRAAMTFAFSIFGRKVIALAGTVILLFATAILFDLKMYISAGLASALSVVTLIVYCVQYRRQIKANRLRAQRQKEEAVRRAAASTARAEKMDRAKGKVTDTVKGMTAGAADMVGVAKTGFAGASGRIRDWRK